MGSRIWPILLQDRELKLYHIVDITLTVVATETFVIFLIVFSYLILINARGKKKVPYGG